MTDTATSWIDRFAGLNTLSPDLRRRLDAGSQTLSVPAGTEVFEPGRPADNMLLLLEGTVRVYQQSDTGREVFLYRVQAGESCVLTTACMLAFEEYSAHGVTETDVQAVAISRATFDALTGQSDDFRNFVFRSFSRRITDLFSLIDDIVFQRLDVRLAARLLELVRDGEVRATHQVLATELGTAREVISRTLSEFHRRGWVEQARGRIRITDRSALERLARNGQV